MIWTSTFPLYKLKHKKYISLPGKLYLSTCAVKFNSLRNETLTVVWINDNYKKFHHFMELKAHKYSVNKTVTRSIKLLKFGSGLGDNRVYKEFYLILEEKKNRTWNQASKLCQDLVDGNLLWFESKERLHELISLFKLSAEIPAIEAIYIGLRFNAVEVSKYFLSILLNIQLESNSIDLSVYCCKMFVI